MQRKIIHRAPLALVAAALLATQQLHAATLIYDTATSAGITTGNGTWNFDSTSVWSDTDAGSNPLLKWTSNTDTAQFAPTGGGATVTVNGSNGQVGAAGLVFTGNAGSGTLLLQSTGGATLELGAGGVTNDLTSGLLRFTVPLSLTSSQTFSSSLLRTNSNGGGVRIEGPISSASGTTNLVFDGRGLTSSTATSNSDNRVSFTLSGVNTFSGSTTVTGGAVLILNYGNDNTSRLDDASALVLGGASLTLNGGPSTVNVDNNVYSTVQEIVGSTLVSKGANTVYLGASGGGGVRSRLVMNALTRTAGDGGTLDISNAAGGIAFTTTTNTNDIIGGWATVSNGWAVSNSDGVTPAAISGNTGSQLGSSASWTPTSNVNANGNEANIASKTINALRLNSANRTLAFASDALLTITSGGIIGGASSGQSISGGAITTGFSSGELFIHTPSESFTLGSSIVDNGSTATTLVKAGRSTLVLTGANTYTGRTIINSGTLQMDGSLANSNVLITGGAVQGTGSLQFNIDNDSADVITIEAGTIDISSLDLNFDITGLQTQSEYVLVNRAVGSSFVIGSEFGSILNLPANWSIDYDGTDLNPGTIVAVVSEVAVPEPTGVAVMGVMGLSMLLRRNRR